MKIRTKITVITGILLLLSLVLAWWQYLLEQERVQLYLDGVTVEEQESFGRLVALSGSRLAIFASDYTAWDDMAAYVQNPDPVFTEENIDVSIPTFNASEAFIYNARKELLYAKNADLHDVSPPPFVADIFDRLLEERLAHFFAETDGVLTEFRTATIHPSDDLERLTEPQGLFVVARRWDDGHIAVLEELSGTTIVSEREQEPRLDVVSISFPYAVRGWDDRIVETFTVMSPFPVVDKVERASAHQLWVIVVSYAVLLVMMYIILHVLVGRPIQALSRGIVEKNIPLMKAMQRSRSEFGALAKLVLDFSEYEQKAAFEQSKRDFISFVSHELRTPLTSLRWAIEKLQLTKKPTAAVLASTVSYMSSAVERITSLITAIVETSKIEVGSIVIEKVPLELAALVSHSSAALKPAIQAKKLKLLIKDETSGDTAVQSDERLLSIIINNIISNAVRYSDERGTVRITMRKEGRELVLSAANTGPGIPLEEQPKIFTKMFRAANAPLLSPDGAGLGLYISKSFLEKLGGSISFTSDPGKETVFTVRLPINGLAKENALEER